WKITLEDRVCIPRSSTSFHLDLSLWRLYISSRLNGVYPKAFGLPVLNPARGICRNNGHCINPLCHRTLAARIWVARRATMCVVSPCCQRGTLSWNDGIAAHWSAPL